MIDKKKNESFDQVQSKITGLVKAVHRLPAKDRLKLIETVSAMDRTPVDVPGQRLVGKDLEQFKAFLKKVDAGETSGPPKHDPKTQRKNDELLANALERFVPEYSREIAAQQKKGESFNARKMRIGGRK